MLKGGWLFAGQNPVNPISYRQLSRACHDAVTLVGFDKHVTLHSLRHNAEFRIIPSSMLPCVCHLHMFNA
jgi:hypothetical protein